MTTENLPASGEAKPETLCNPTPVQEKLRDKLLDLSDEFSALADRMNFYRLGADAIAARAAGNTPRFECIGRAGDDLIDFMAAFAERLDEVREFVREEAGR